MLLSCAVAVPFVWFMCPETTGKTLEEIDLLFAKKSVQDSAWAEHALHHKLEKNIVDMKEGV